MKKFLAFLFSAIFVWGGLWLALLAKVSEDSPIDHGGLAIIAALLFCVAILFAGYGNSITWKGQKKEQG